MSEKTDEKDESSGVKDLKSKFEPPRGPGKIKWEGNNQQGKKRINEPGEIKGQERPKGPPPKKNLDDLP